MPGAMPLPERWDLSGQRDLCLPSWMDGTASPLTSPAFKLLSLFFGSNPSHVHVSPVLLCRVQSAQSDVQREGLDRTVQRSASATTAANVTQRLDSVSALKASLETGRDERERRSCDRAKPET